MGIKSGIFFKTIRIFNFKSYKKISEIGPCHPMLNIIIGPNGTGKSNFLDAVLFVLGKKATKIRFKRLKDIIYVSDLNRKKHASVILILKKIYKKNVFSVFFSKDVFISRQIFKDNSSHYYFNGKEISFSIFNQINQLIGISMKNDRYLIQQGEIEKISTMKPKGDSSNEIGLLEYTEDTFGSSRYSEILNKNKKIFDFIDDQTNYKKKNLIYLQNLQSGIYIIKKKNLFSFKKKNYILNQINFFNHYCILLLLAKKVKKKTKNFPYKSIHKILNKKIYKFYENKRQHEKYFFFSKKNFSILKYFYYLSTKLFYYSKKKNFILENQKNFFKKKKKIRTIIKKPIFSNEKFLNKIASIVEKQKQKQFFRKKIIFCSKSLNYFIKKTNASDSYSIDYFFLTKIFFLNTFQMLKIIIQKTKFFLIFYDFFFNSIKKLKKVLENFHHYLTLMILERRHNPNKMQFFFISSLQKKKIKKLNYNSIEESINFIKELGDIIKKNFFFTSNNFNKKKKNEKLAFMKSNLFGIIDCVGSIGFVKFFLSLAFFSTLFGHTQSIIIDTTLNSLYALEFLKNNKIERTQFFVIEKLNFLKFNAENQKIKKFNFLKAKIYCKKEFKKLFFFLTGNTIVAKDLTQGLRIAFESTTRKTVVTLDGVLIEKSGFITGGGISTKYFFFTQNRSISNLNWIKKYDYIQIQFQSNQTFFKFISIFFFSFKKIDWELNIYVDFKFFFTEIFLIFSIYIMVKIFEKQIKKNWREYKIFSEILEKNILKIYIKKKKNLEKKKYLLNLFQKSIFNNLSKYIIKKFFFRKKKEKKKNNCLYFFKKLFFNEEKKKSLYILKFLIKNINTKEIKKNVKKTTTQIDYFGVFFRTFDITTKFYNTLLTIAKIEFYRFLQIINDLKLEINDKSSDIPKTKESNFCLENLILLFKKKKTRFKMEIKKIFWFSKQIEYFASFSYFFNKKKNFQKKNLSLKKAKVKPKTWFLEKSAKQFNMKFFFCSFFDEKLETKIISFYYILELFTYIFDIRSRFVEFNKLFIRKIFNQNKNLHVHIQRTYEYLRYFLDFNNNLRIIFPNFYPEGIMEINVANPLDPFDKGIVLSIKPPGKTWKSVIYLSGGEKTLSSLAFVFSLQDINEISWYLLDEIDAALDYKNVEKLSKYFRVHSFYQILIISLRNNMLEETNHALGIYKIFSGTKSIVLKNHNYLI